MRIVQKSQMQIGEVDISNVIFDRKSRDGLTKLLMGLQYLYLDIPIRNKIFKLLEEKISPNINKNIGRPGMPLWTILVLGSVRLNINFGYDALHDLANNHANIRKMIGHGTYNDQLYRLQTIMDNVCLLTPELLDEINQLVVAAGHCLVKKKDEELHGRCDSAVLETNVHFPTDINLLYDAMRKMITATAEWCDLHGVGGWRQYQYNTRHVKRLVRTAQNKKRSKAQSEAQKEKNEKLIIEAHQYLLDVAEYYLSKVQATLAMLEKQGHTSEFDVLRKIEIEGYIQHALRQIDQTKRRVILGETIPHAEKVFSIFQPHTEWISKGKVGVPVELGLRVCILEDQFQFILHHEVMEKKTDDQVTVSMVAEAKKRFPDLNSCSFDKGFHSKGNQIELKEHLELVALPRKGKLSKQAREEEEAETFVKARRAHSAVESAFNALEVHGLDMCPDHGIDGFKRYVALAVVAKNIHRLGAILLEQAKKRERRGKLYIDCTSPYKQAA